MHTKVIAARARTYTAVTPRAAAGRLDSIESGGEGSQSIGTERETRE
ncbi:hypothetical protein AB0942_27740 [Streptomyces nodosus]